uniref:Down syndrome cell adhesion molecule-like protein Dscam2 n=1 Tax=Strigamia maritima TaxID=126957 RepID=T1JP33_STRMM
VRSTPIEGPKFKVEPPYNVVFSNNSGSKVLCSAVGQPTPTVDWILPDGSRVGNVPGLRQLGPEGVLYFPPFSAEDYRQDVHAVSYKCTANNAAGTIVSRNVNVRAVMSQQYEAHVYDAFPLEGNTAVLKCHLPQFIGSHVVISAWIKDNAVKIESSITKDTKYTIYSDELFILDVGEKDSVSSFRCQTTNTLTREIKLSSTAGKLFVSEPKGNVSPRIVDSTVSASATAGTDVTLPCIAQGFPVPELEWFIKSSNGQLIPIAFGNQFSQLKISMTIQQIETSDAGIYVCVAKNSVGTESKEINVTVSVPLSALVEPKQLKLETNKMATLKCAIKGSPITAATWVRNGQIFHSNNLTDSIRIKESGMYQCFVRNEEYMVQDVAQVTAGDKLPEILSGFEEKILEPGKHLKIECVVEGNPLPSINWFIDKKAVEESNRISIRNHNGKVDKITSVLEISNLKTADGGIYSCHFKNVKGAVKHASRINVMGDPGIRKMDKILTIAGTSVQIDCPFYGYPINQVKWMKGLQSIPFEPRQFLHKNGSLIIAKLVRGSDDGKYLCLVNNGKKEEKQDVEMVVMMPPKIMPFSFQETLIREGMRARLQCVISEGDTPIKIEWLKDNDRIPPNIGIHLRHLDEFSSILSIANINPKHNGNYTCKATNDAAIATHTTVLNVNALPKVIPFSFLDDQFYKGMRAQVTCSVSQGDQPLLFQWSKNDQILINYSLGITIRQYDPFTSSLSIENVAAEHSGNYTCIVSNHAGSANYTSQLLVHVAPKIIPFSFQPSMAEGTQARVLCGLGEGDAPVIFSWLKNGLPISQKDIVIVRTPDNFSSILSVPKVHRSHSGNFTCVATNHAATAEFTTAPKIIPFSFQEDNLIEGVFARVSCVVYQGDLPISISWLKDEQPIHNVNGITIRNIDEFSSILTIDSIQQRHSGNYTCVAENFAATANSTTPLIVNVPPKIVPFTFQDEHLLEGMLVRVSCVVSRGDLPLTINWLKDSHPIPKDLSITISDFDEYSSILSIENVTSKHNGNYTCIASNAAASIKYSTLLFVNVPPKWIQTPNDMSTVIGEEVKLPCATEGFPVPLVTWTKSEAITEKRQLIVNNRHQSVLKNGTLHIFSVQEKDKGFYFCEAQNGIGELGAMLQITIKSPPKMIKQYQALTPHKNEEVKLSCKAYGDSPIKFTWKKEGNGLNLTKSQYSVKSDITNNMSLSELKIHHINHMHSATYQCIATNSYGSDEASFHLSVKDVPKPPKNLKLLESSNRTVSVSWSLQDAKISPTKRHIIQYKRIAANWKDGALNYSAPGKLNSAKLSKLLPSQKYHIRVLAENEVGFSEPSNQIEVKVADEAPDGTPNDITVMAIDTNTLKISWEPPVKDQWNGIIRGYYVGYKVVGSTAPYTFKLIEVPDDYMNTLSLTITDLVKFTHYSIVVQAFNDGGKGPMSKEVVAVTSESVPSKAPVDIRCSVLGSQSIHITWQPAPFNTIHGVLQGYKVFYKPTKYESPQNGKTQATFKTSSTTKITLYKLLMYTNYSIQILAYTKKGDGIKSDPIYCRTLEDAPGPVADIKVLPASQTSILVAWQPPEHTNGAITKYIIYIKDDMETISQREVNGNEHYYEVNLLKHGENYEIWVSAATAVGQGPKSRSISQSPGMEKIPARVAVFNSVIVTIQDKDVKLPCPAIGIPEPRKNGPVMKSKRIVALSDGALLIKDIQRHESENYTCHVENERGDDLVTYSVIVQTVPEAVTLDIALTTTTSIDILWKAKNDGSTPITEFKLVYKNDNMAWKTLDLEPHIESYRLENLRCGTQYQLYMLAVNNIGEGKATSVITTSTKGGAPIIPEKQFLIDEGSSFITLNLNSWQTDSCLIKYFVIEYKPKLDSQWNLFSDDVQNDNRKILLSDLKPATWYDLRMIAHSNAGAAVAEFTFATLTEGGATISPDTVIEALPKSPLAVLLDLKFIVIFVTVIFAALAVVLTLLCYCAKNKKKKSRRHRSHGSHVDSDELTPYATARLADFQEHRRSQIPTAPPMSDSYSCNSLPFYSQIHKKGNQGPMTPNRSILKNVVLSVPPVPLTQPPELITQRLVKSGDGAARAPEELPNSEAKPGNHEKYDSPWDLKGIPNN